MEVNASSHQDVLDYFPVNIRQPVIAALEPVNQSFMVNAQAVQNGGVKIMHMDRIFRDVVAIIIGLTVAESRFDSPSGHPDGKTARMVVAAE